MRLFFFFLVIVSLTSVLTSKILHPVDKTMASWPIRPDLYLLRCIVHPDHILSSSVLNCAMQGFLPYKTSCKIAANVANELVKFDAITQPMLSLSYNTLPRIIDLSEAIFNHKKLGKSRKKTPGALIFGLRAIMPYVPPKRPYFFLLAFTERPTFLPTFTQ